MEIGSIFVLPNSKEDMKNLTEQSKTEYAIQLVIMDAIEKGHTNVSELTDYMKSETFEKSVKNYINLFNEN